MLFNKAKLLGKQVTKHRSSRACPLSTFWLTWRVMGRQFLCTSVLWTPSWFGSWREIRIRVRIIFWHWIMDNFGLCSLLSHLVTFNPRMIQVTQRMHEKMVKGDLWTILTSSKYCINRYFFYLVLIKYGISFLFL